MMPIEPETVMLFAQPTVMLFAQRNAQLVQNLRLRSTTDFSSFLTALVLVLAVIGIVLLAKRCFSETEKRRSSSPRRLFHELCRAHQLSWGERQLLVKLAAWHALPHPAALFLEPARFEVAGTLFEPLAPQFAQLRSKLFA